MASSAFSKALANKKASIAKMADVKAGNREYVLPNIDPGPYTFAVDAECGVTDNKNVPYVKFNWSIQTPGDFYGKGNNTVFWLDGDKPDQVDKTFERLAKTFMALLDLTEVNVEDPQDIEQLVDMVNDDKTLCEGKLTTWESEAGKKGFNVYFNKRVAAVA